MTDAPPLASSIDPPSRWFALGDIVDENTSHGIWLKCGRIEEWKKDGAREARKFTPRTLLIRWEAIITVHILDSDEEAKEFGSKPDR